MLIYLGCIQTHAHWYFNAGSRDQQTIAEIIAYICFQKEHRNSPQLACYRVSISRRQDFALCPVAQVTQEIQSPDDSGVRVPQQLVTLWLVEMWVNGFDGPQ